MGVVVVVVVVVDVVEDVEVVEEVVVDVVVDPDAQLPRALTTLSYSVTPLLRLKSPPLLITSLLAVIEP